MNLGIIIATLSFTLLLISCSHVEQQHAVVRFGSDLSLQQSPAETVLNCLQSHWDLSRKEYKTALKTAKNKFESQQSEYNRLQLICMNIHPSAKFSQFRDSIQQLSKYSKEHPKDISGLTGIQHLLELIDRERILRWNASNKYDKETKNLIERNQQLTKEAEQDKERLKELNKQIDQLKNIESIIKNREF